MERMVIWLLPKERAALKALAKATQRTGAGTARMLIVEGLRRRSLYMADLDQAATEEALRSLQEDGNGNGASEA